MQSSALTKIVLTWFFVLLVGLNDRVLEAGQSPDLKPEKNKLEVAIAATGPPDALSAFLLGNAEGLIVTPPQSEMARSKGFPVIVVYYERGLKIIAPGTGGARAFAQKNPNALKIFRMGYLDGVKRSIDDPAYASRVLAQSSKITDAKLLEDSYQEGVKVWNKDMTVDPEAIKVVLEQSTVPKAAELDPKKFFDNTLIRDANRDYASTLFPREVR